MGAKIPRPGYLGPHLDIYCFDLKKNHKLVELLSNNQKNGSVYVFPAFFFPNFWLELGGGGQDTLAGVSWPSLRYILF